MPTAELLDAVIQLDGDRLTLSNNRMLRQISLVGGLFATTRLVNRATGREWAAPAGPPRSFLSFAGHAAPADSEVSLAQASLEVVERPVAEQPHVRATMVVKLWGITLGRTYVIYPGCPATACWTEVNGTIEGREEAQTCDRRGRRLLPESAAAPPAHRDVHDWLQVRDPHLRVRNTRFTDCTDLNDSYVQEEERDAFDTHVPWLLEGNLLVAESLIDGEGFYLLKESPVLADQPDHPDADFLCDFSKGLIAQTGWGMTPSDVVNAPAVHSWRTVVGVFGPVEGDAQTAVKSYLRNRCREVPGRDWLVTANQWGDRGEGKQLGEAFVRAEIDRCAELGIEAYMLDAGWQVGDISKVSPDAPESPFYGREEFWTVDRAKFPDGLGTLADYAKQRGVQLLFWHNPDPTDQNANHERDAGLLLSLWRDYGARVLKIDGVWNITRLAEMRNRAMLERVIEESGGEVSFQLDITQGVRWGFVGAIPLGVLFVENRYTHWRNYFPYKVHRNLWELSRYLRPQRLQFEFLNNAADRAAFYQPDFPVDDPFRPDRYTLDYIFATVMFANPLASMEPSALTAEQCRQLRPALAAYTAIRDEMFRGEIYPLGEKPSGRSLTAFQSHNATLGTGFVCVYREATSRSDAVIQLHGMPDPSAYQFEKLLGQGTVTAHGDACVFHLPEERSYALFRYSQR